MPAYTTILATCASHYTLKPISPYPIRQGDDVQVTGQQGRLRTIPTGRVHPHPFRILPYLSRLPRRHAALLTPDHKAPEARSRCPKLGTLGPTSLHTYVVYNTLQAADDPVDPFRGRGPSEMTCIGSRSTSTYGHRGPPLLISSPVCLVPVPT